MEKDISKEMIDKRILYKLERHGAIAEDWVKEITPEGNYVKIGRTWYRIYKSIVVSILEQ